MTSRVVIAEPPIDIQDLPEASSDERAHVLDRDCWCHPLVEVVDRAPRVKHRKACTHRDDHGSTIIFVQDRPRDGVCLLCNAEFPAAAQ